MEEKCARVGLKTKILEMKAILRKRNSRYSRILLFYTFQLFNRRKLPFLWKGKSYTFYLATTARLYFNIQGYLLYRRYKSLTYNSSVSLISSVSRTEVQFTFPLYFPKLGF